MDCRSGCGACCIAPSISTHIPGMSGGKPSGTACIHLRSDYTCDIFDSPERPKVCADFRAEKLICGNNREEALQIMYSLEIGR